MEEKNRHFSREFKRDAVQLATEKGKAVGNITREFDIRPNFISMNRIGILFLSVVYFV